MAVPSSGAPVEPSAAAAPSAAEEPSAVPALSAAKAPSVGRAPEPSPPTEPLPVGSALAAHPRHWGVNAIFALAVLVGILAVLAVWVNRQLLNTNNWTNTSSHLLADPKIEAAIGAVLVDELFNSVDVAAELKKVLPSEVGGLAAPAAAGLRTLAIQIAPQVLSTGPVQNAWRVANREAQIELVHILKGGGKTVSTDNGVVTLQLHSLLTQLATQVGLRDQFASVGSKLEGSTGAVAKTAVEEKLGVKLPALSGGIVILRSSQLSTAQQIVKAIQGLAIVLSVIALVLFLLAIWLAEGWRRVALRTTGWCLVAIGLITVLVRRVLGNVVVDSLLKVPADKPAAHQAFTIGTSLLFEIAVAMITYGLVLVLAAWIAGHTRAAQALRRALAPALREHVQYVEALAALALLLVVIWGPFPSTREPLPIVGFAILLALGIQALRRITAQEYPDAQLGEFAQGLRAWYSARRQSTLASISKARTHMPGTGAAEPSIATAPDARLAGPAERRLADLERLSDLRDRGALTDEEFQIEKTTLLKRAT